MNREEIRQAFLDALASLAPGADVSHLPPEADIRDALDIDSFAMLNLMVDLQKRLGVAVPEKDYRRLTTVTGAIDYLAGRLGVIPSAAPGPPQA